MVNLCPMVIVASGGEGGGRARAAWVLRDTQIALCSLQVSAALSLCLRSPQVSAALPLCLCAGLRSLQVSAALSVCLCACVCVCACACVCRAFCMCLTI